MLLMTDFTGKIALYRLWMATRPYKASLIDVSAKGWVLTSRDLRTHSP